ncbi:hypothetical protein [Capnocytophaga sp. oral taxon 338]|jgi:hypothetical protein|uniref:hypothetical protein n=1 Tax=Capnocytophaga sp. oral taxon 338 TaxID=710239 RepID=UPI000202CC17|nr:hypothetical protein [Capnocytophaga sp. oral taxon 338]EGD33253.1 hypothetical protein HMPREF9071_2047 [Capnocytophaga sp. oral taxon 338 str. F0234]
MNLKIITTYSLLAVLLSSCYWLDTPKKNSHAVARVGDYYLYEEDIRKLLPKDYTLEDSLQIVTPYIDNWALKKLLLLKAEENISNAKKEEFEHLVSQYRTDLYTQSYLDLLSRQVDTAISKQERELFYQENKDIFKLNEELIQLRYIQLSPSSLSPKIINAFKNFSPKDKQYIDSLAPHFTSSFLNDSMWVRASEVREKLPMLASRLNKRFSHQFLEDRDSTNVYLLKINNFLDNTDYAPLNYVYPTLQQIILNKRRSNYINDLEKEIINNAIEKKQFEIYEQN